MIAKILRFRRSSLTVDKSFRHLFTSLRDRLSDSTNNQFDQFHDLEKAHLQIHRRLLGHLRDHLFIQLGIPLRVKIDSKMKT